MGRPAAFARGRASVVFDRYDTDAQPCRPVLSSGEAEWEGLLSPTWVASNAQIPASVGSQARPTAQR